MSFELHRSQVLCTILFILFKFMTLLIVCQSKSQSTLISQIYIVALGVPPTDSTMKVDFVQVIPGQMEASFSTSME